MIDPMPHAPGPLVREVEFPRRAASMWGPILALLACAMVTLMTAIAVTARPPRRAQHLDHRSNTVIAPVIAPAGAPVTRPTYTRYPALTITPADDRCADRVRRASPDGDVAVYEDCTTPH